MHPTLANADVLHHWWRDSELHLFLVFPASVLPHSLGGSSSCLGGIPPTGAHHNPSKYTLYICYTKIIERTGPKFLPRCDPTRCVTLATCWLLSSTVDTDCHVAIDVVFPALSAPSHVDLWGWPCQVTSSGKKPSRLAPNGCPKRQPNSSNENNFIARIVKHIGDLWISFK